MNLQNNMTGIGHNPALIVVDMIYGFTDPACPLGHACADVVAVNRVLADAFRAAGLPIVFTTVVYHDLSADSDAAQQPASVFRQRLPDLNLLSAGSIWTDVHATLARQSNEPLIEKQWASAFFKTSLAEQLIQLNVDSLVVTGLTTSGCVRATAVDGLQHNYPVSVVADAVGDRNQAAHAANLFDLNAKYADVVNSNDIIEHLATLTLIEDRHDSPN